MSSVVGMVVEGPLSMNSNVTNKSDNSSGIRVAVVTVSPEIGL